MPTLPLEGKRKTGQRRRNALALSSANNQQAFSLNFEIFFFFENEITLIIFNLILLSYDRIFLNFTNALSIIYGDKLDVI
jgi:hypothetical protein